MGDEPEHWEPRQDLLRAATDAGYKLSGSRLGRLHRAGLIPSPRTRPLGRGRGTRSEFPPATTTRLLRVLELQRTETSAKFTTIAWRLWWEDGGPPSRPATDLLTDTARLWDKQRDALRELLTREAAGDSDALRDTEALYRSLEEDRVQGPLGVTRRNSGRDGFSTVGRVFAEVAAGHFSSFEDHEPEAQDGTPRAGTTGALIERALGLDRARSDAIAGREPRFTGSSETHLRLLSELLGTRSLLRLAEDTPAEALEEPREEIRNLLTLIATFTPLIERTLGGDVAGYRTIGRAMDIRSPRAQASVLLAWLALREDRQLLAGLRDLVGRLPQAIAAAELQRMSSELAQQVPALGPALQAAHRATLLGDAEQSTRSREEIKRISAEHRDRVDAFFAARPQVEQLIATATSSDADDPASGAEDSAHASA